jgi:hypothetical protein
MFWQAFARMGIFSLNLTMGLLPNNISRELREHLGNGRRGDLLQSDAAADFAAGWNCMLSGHTDSDSAAGAKSGRMP